MVACASCRWWFALSVLESVCSKQSDKNARPAEIIAPVVSDLNKRCRLQMMTNTWLKRTAAHANALKWAFHNKYCIRLNLQMAAVLWFTVIYCVWALHHTNMEPVKYSKWNIIQCSTCQKKKNPKEEQCIVRVELGGINPQYIFTLVLSQIPSIQ